MVALSVEPSVGASFVRRVAWAPEGVVKGGSDSLRRWRGRALEGQPFDCDAEDNCRLTVFAAPSGRAKDLQERIATPINHRIMRTFETGRFEVDTLSPGETPIRNASDTLLAECDVARIGQSIGVPHDCTHFAILNGSERWIRVTAGNYADGLPRGPFPLPGEAYPPPPRAGVGKPINLASLCAAIAAELAAQPLRLTTNIRARRVRGAVNYQPSRVLRPPPPYREILDVDIEVEANRSTNDVGFLVVVHAYVNPQNTEDGYARPSGAQMAEYESTVRAVVLRAAARVCASAQWFDASTFRCR